jgi:hypothetical protein
MIHTRPLTTARGGGFAHGLRIAAGVQAFAAAGQRQQRRKACTWPGRSTGASRSARPGTGAGTPRPARRTHQGGRAARPARPPARRRPSPAAPPAPAPGCAAAPGGRWVHAQRAQRVDLFAGLHGGQLRGEGRTHAAGQDHAGHQARPVRAPCPRSRCRRCRPGRPACRAARRPCRPASGRPGSRSAPRWDGQRAGLVELAQQSPRAGRCGRAAAGPGPAAPRPRRLRCAQPPANARSATAPARPGPRAALGRSRGGSAARPWAGPVPAPRCTSSGSASSCSDTPWRANGARRSRNAAASPASHAASAWASHRHCARRQVCRGACKPVVAAPRQSPASTRVQPAPCCCQRWVGACAASIMVGRTVTAPGWAAPV